MVWVHWVKRQYCKVCVMWCSLNNSIMKDGLLDIVWNGKTIWWKGRMMISWNNLWQKHVIQVPHRSHLTKGICGIKINDSNSEGAKTVSIILQLIGKFYVSVWAENSHTNSQCERQYERDTVMIMVMRYLLRLSSIKWRHMMAQIKLMWMRLGTFTTLYKEL